jgi:hypothetical protein
MGCGGSKDKQEDAGKGGPAPDPVEKKEGAADGGQAQPAPAEATEKHPSKKNVFEAHMSDDLNSMMNDYFNRYDLDGSQTINSVDELKQLCTNLVVKLDLDMDVGQIDEKVSAAGDMTKKNWKYDEKNDDGECFALWFVETFQINRDWKEGDESSDEAEPTEDHPIRHGTYEGELTDETGEIKYTGQGSKERPTLFRIRIRYEEGLKLMPRMGCDHAGYFRHEGEVQADGSLTYIREYDVDNNPETIEPKIVLMGMHDKKGRIEGTWVNVSVFEGGDKEKGHIADHETSKAFTDMKHIGLENIVFGKFWLQKLVHE